jgi:hypothetical protein
VLVPELLPEHQIRHRSRGKRLVPPPVRPRPGRQELAVLELPRRELEVARRLLEFPTQVLLAVLPVQVLPTPVLEGGPLVQVLPMQVLEMVRLLPELPRLVPLEARLEWALPMLALLEKQQLVLVPEPEFPRLALVQVASAVHPRLELEEFPLARGPERPMLVFPEQVVHHLVVLLLPVCPGYRDCH